MPLKITSHEKGLGCFTVSPIGSLDNNTSIHLEKHINMLMESKPKIIVLDMNGLDFISSAGVRVVFKTKKGVESAGGSFAMANLKPGIKKVFDIINALPSLRIFESIKELDDYLTLMQKGQ